MCLRSLTLILQSWALWPLSLGYCSYSVLRSQCSLGVLRSCGDTPRVFSFDHGLCRRCPRPLQPGLAECAKRLNQFGFWLWNGERGGAREAMKPVWLWNGKRGDLSLAVAESTRGITSLKCEKRLNLFGSGKESVLVTALLLWL